MNIYNLIGQNIKKYRKRINLTQEQLANKCNLSYGYIKNLESKKVHTTISIETLQLVANNLGVKLAELLEEQKNDI